MNARKYIIFTIIFLIGCAISYRIGIHLTTKAYSKGLDETQAMLAFNHMQRYEEISKCLSQGKTADAAQKLDMSIIDEKELIADFLKSTSSQKLNEYISIRYSGSLDELKNFKNTRGSNWTESSCK